MKTESSPATTLSDILKARLKSNESVLQHLPEVMYHYPKSWFIYSPLSSPPALGIRSPRFVFARTPAGSYPSLEARS